MNHMLNRADLIEKVNKNKIAILIYIVYSTIRKLLALRLEPTFKRLFFIICQSTALCIRLWILIVRFH